MKIACLALVRHPADRAASPPARPAHGDAGLQVKGLDTVELLEWTGNNLARNSVRRTADVTSATWRGRGRHRLGQSLDRSAAAPPTADSRDVKTEALGCGNPDDA